MASGGDGPRLPDTDDPYVLLGVDRALAKGDGEREALEGHPQVLLFNGFPSARKLRERLTRLGEAGSP